MYIRILFVHRGHIEFEIARVDNSSFGGIKDNTQAVRNTVIGIKEASGDLAEREDGVRIDAIQAGLT